MQVWPAGSGAPTVLGSAGRRLSTTSSRRSQALADSAHCKPSRRTRLGSECACERTTGPWATPPPRLKEGQRELGAKPGCSPVAQPLGR